MGWKKRRRTSLEIVHDILCTLEHKSQSKTAIMHKANLNFKRVDSYMYFLLSKGLVSTSEDYSSRRYFITKKGLDFLKDYRELKESEEKLMESLKRLERSLSLGGA